MMSIEELAEELYYERISKIEELEAYTENELNLIYLDCLKELKEK